LLACLERVFDRTPVRFLHPGRDDVHDTGALLRTGVWNICSI